MPKRNPFNLIESVKVKTESQFIQPIQPVEPTQETSKLTLRVDANYKLTGRASGQEYVFHGAGATLDVLKEDVEWFLSLRQGKGCCGGGGGNNIFQLSGE